MYTEDFDFFFFCLKFQKLQKIIQIYLEKRRRQTHKEKKEASDKELEKKQNVLVAVVVLF